MTLLLCWAASPARLLGSKMRKQSCLPKRFSDLKINDRFLGKNTFQLSKLHLKVNGEGLASVKAVHKPYRVWAATKARCRWPETALCSWGDFWSAWPFLIKPKICTTPALRGYTNLIQVGSRYHAGQSWASSVLQAEGCAIWTCGLIVHGGNVHMHKGKCICKCWESRRYQLALRK